jgi:zinc-ribbon domain
MKCSRCQTELPDSATFCPSCGLTAEQQGQTAAFSYLPAGTPPWPTVVPPRLPYIVDAAPVPGAAAQTPRTKKPEKTGASAGGIIGIIAVLILAPLIGAIATFAIVATQASSAPSGAGPAANNTNTQQIALPTPEGTPSQASPASTAQSGAPGTFKTTQDTGVNVSLSYPATWVATPRPLDQGNAALLIGPAQDTTGETFFGIIRFSDTLSSSIPDADTLNSAGIENESTAQGVHNLQKIQPANSQPTFGGAKWAQQEAVFMDDNNQKIHYTTLSVLHNKTYYSIAYNSPDASYNDNLQKYFMPMLNSIKFLS